MSIDQQLSDIIDAAKKSSDPRELKQTIFKYLETIPPKKENPKERNPMRGIIEKTHETIEVIPPARIAGIANDRQDAS